MIRLRPLYPFLLGLCSLSVWAEELPSVTPYRPTVSNPAVLSQPGWLELETGWNQARAKDGSKSANLPYTLKYAFSSDFGILLGGDAYVSQSDPAGGSLSGNGDTLLLLKQRWDAGTDSAFGVEYGAKLPTAKKNLGSGASDYLVNGIYSTEMSGNTLDFNLGLTQMGAVAQGESRQQWSWAATWSRPLDETWGIGVELSGSARGRTPPLNQFLMALGYSVNRRIVLDAGLSKGISPESPDWALFCGVSALLGKIR